MDGFLERVDGGAAVGQGRGVGAVGTAACAGGVRADT